MASLNVPLKSPYLDLTQFSAADKIKEMKRAGYPEKLLKNNSFDQSSLGTRVNYFKQNRKLFEAVNYNSEDPIAVQQALFHQTLLEKLKSAGIFLYDTTWIRDNGIIIAFLVKLQLQGRKLLTERVKMKDI